MLHKHLGELDGPVLIFGGPYSNLQALQAMERTAMNWKIPQSNIICTGDLVAYCADPEDTLKLIRNTDYQIVAGNVEKQLAVDGLHCGCGFDPNSKCAEFSSRWYLYVEQYTSAKNRAWMSTLPDIVSFFHLGKRYAVIHGGITDVSRFVWSVSPDEVFIEEINTIEALIGPIDGVIAGHSGIPFSREVAGKTWVNTGVIGMPPHDGGRNTRFGLLSDTMEIHQLEYDWRAAQTAMKQDRWTQDYADALETGIWPSEEVLPAQLRISR